MPCDVRRTESMCRAHGHTHSHTCYIHSSQYSHYHLLCMCTDKVTQTHTLSGAVTLRLAQNILESQRFPPRPPGGQGKAGRCREEVIPRGHWACPPFLTAPWGTCSCPTFSQIGRCQTQLPSQEPLGPFPGAWEGPWLPHPPGPDCRGTNRSLAGQPPKQLLLLCPSSPGEGGE